MTPDQIKETLRLHKLWLAGDAKGVRAELTDAKLYRADLSGANLSRADLSGAYLSDADLSDADLSRADLSGAYLYRADLSDADLSRANLYRANLYRANLYRADLSRAELTGANLTGANLTGANLTGADLSGAKLTDAKLTDAKLPAFQIPQEGDLIVWKKLRGEILLKLKVTGPRTASLVGRKCRARSVVPLEAFDRDGAPFKGELIAERDRSAYQIGVERTEEKYDPDPAVQCTHGLHFFLTREEAAAYDL